MSPIVGSLANGSTRGYGGLRSFAPDTAFDSIATYIGNGTAMSTTFSSIPSTYKSLQIRIHQLSGGGVRIRLNGDTATNYTEHALYCYYDNAGNSPAVYATGSTSTNGTRIQGWLANASSTSAYVSIVDIIDYASTSKNKTIRAFSGTNQNGAMGEVDLASGVWRVTNAVTSITILQTSNNWPAGTIIALYGVK